MNSKYRFSGGLTQGNRFRSQSNGIVGDKSGFIPAHSDSTSRFRKRSSSRNSKKLMETPNEFRETSAKKIIVLDTSVLVHDPESLDILRGDDNTLAVPWIVLEELNQLKNKPNIGWDAREVIRRIGTAGSDGLIVSK